MMPDDYLDALSVPDRAEYWRRALAGTPRPPSATLVAVDHDETVVGFASVGAAAVDDSDERGELYALNVDPSVWGTGAAVALLEAVTQVLTEVGFVDAVLWVHPDNERARRFYEKAGWRSDELERVELVLGVEVPEIRYSRSLE